MFVRGGVFFLVISEISVDYDIIRKITSIALKKMSVGAFF